ncbi:MAG: hypothetical protein IT383_12170 [Deltaproteobacteria bacterium]|nr:hypothetical protein [Deltaproteobacteria bacterium]
MIASLTLLFILASDCRPGSEGASMDDVDGDGIAETWKAEGGFGSQMAGRSWELTLSSNGRRFSGTVEIHFGSILNVSEVPQPLAESGNDRVREALEHRLFAQVCDTPDPSLAWLLDSIAGSNRRRWHDGLVPVHPSTHTILVRDRRLALALAPESKGAVWVTYLGDTHMKSGIAGDLDAPLLLVERPGRRLLATHHGVILVDTERRRHAWVWVTRSNFKLRFRTICPGARALGRNKVEVEVDPHSPYDESNVRPVLIVDLSNGHTTTGARPKEETWIGCQPDPPR